GLTPALRARKGYFDTCPALGHPRAGAPPDMPYGTAVQVIMNLRERVEDFYKEIPKIRKSLRTRRKPQPDASARRELREREMGGCGGDGEMFQKNVGWVVLPELGPAIPTRFTPAGSPTGWATRNAVGKGCRRERLPTWHRWLRRRNHPLYVTYV